MSADHVLQNCSLLVGQQRILQYSHLCRAQSPNPTLWGALIVADDPKSLGPLRGTALGAAHAEFMEGVGRYFEAGSGLQGSGVQV